MSSPLGLTQQTAERTGTPSDIRQGTVTAVTSRGLTVAIGTGSIEGAGHLVSYNPAVGDTVAMMAYNGSWTVLGRVLGPGTETDNTVPGTGIGKTLLDGQALTKSGAILATSASTGVSVVVPRYSLTFFHPQNHWVEIVATYTYFSTVVGDVLRVELYETSTGTLVDSVDYNVQTGSSWFATVSFAVPPTTLAGAARNYVLRVQRVSGTGNCRLEDHATRRGHFEAWDLGDKSFYRTV